MKCEVDWYFFIAEAFFQTYQKCKNSQKNFKDGQNFKIRRPEVEFIDLVELHEYHGTEDDDCGSDQQKDIANA